MLAKIIPHGTSFSTEPLTYFVGDSFRSEIFPGQLVEIPYGKKNILWVVAEISEQNFEKNNENFGVAVVGKFANFRGENPDEIFDIKGVSVIIDTKPILAPYQLRTIERLAMKYILPIHKALAIFLNEPTLRRLQKYNFPLEKLKKIEENILKNEIFISKNEIISPQLLVPFLKKNLVIVVPDDILLARFENFFQKNPEILDKKIMFYPSEMTETKRAQAFVDIYNKKSEIIIWTRRLLQYNLSRYDEIWYLEDSFSGEYFHYPVRIAYTDFLAHIADSEQFSIKIFSSTPRLKTLSQFHFFDLHHL